MTAADENETSTDYSNETPYGWVVVFASFFIIATGLASNYLVVVGIKPMAAEFGWPRWIPSAAYSAIALGSGIGGVFVGMYADKRSIGGPLLIAAFSIGLGAILVSRVTDAFSMLFFCAVVIGFFGNGAAFSPLTANITRWFDRRRGLAVAIVTCGQSLAGAAWAPLFRFGIEEYGWRQTWLAYGAFAVCVLVPLSFLMWRKPPNVAPGTAPPVERHRIDSALPPLLLQIVLALAIIGCCVAMAMPIVQIVSYCSDLGFGLDNGAKMLSVLLGCSVASRLAFGWLSDRIGGLQTIAISSVLQASALVLFAFVDSMTGLYLVSGLFGLVFGGIVPAYALATRQLFPVAQAAGRIGVIFLAGYLGMAAGGFLGGFVFDQTGDYRIAFLVGVMFNLANLVFICLIFLSRRRPDREPSVGGRPVRVPSAA